MGNVIMSGIVPPLVKPVTGTPIGDVVVGSTLKLKENGKLVDFYVACHDYESGLNGVGRILLVRKDCYDSRAWHSGDENTYASSDIDSWLNETYLSLFDESVRNAIGTTTFYYTTQTGGDTTTLERKIFLLSGTELGLMTTQTWYMYEEGSALPSASMLKVAYLNGSATTQWTRSPGGDGSNLVCRVNANGAVGQANMSYVYGVRPCFTLPATALVAEDGTIIV